MPELLVGKALEDLFSARAPINNDLARLALDDGTEWGQAHAYFANMGGFVLDFTVVLDFSEMLNQQSPETSLDNASALIRLADEVASDFKLFDNGNLRRMRHKVWALTARQILEARRFGLIQTLPQVSGRSLEGFSKGDTLVKFLALVQVSWLIIQLIARKIARLPSSQLETAALAFSASSIITYLLYWNHPQDVETIWNMKALRLPTKEEMKSLVKVGPGYFSTGLRRECSIDSDYDLVPMPNDAIPDDNGSGFVLGVIIGGTVFGSLHCLAWNFHFPTPAEALVWKICSIVTTVIPLASLPFLYVTQWLVDWLPIPTNNVKNYLDENTGRILFYTSPMPYVLARLFLMVEVFRTLFFLPPEAFIDTWSGNFPHWG